RSRGAQGRPAAAPRGARGAARAPLPLPDLLRRPRLRRGRARHARAQGRARGQPRGDARERAHRRDQQPPPPAPRARARQPRGAPRRIGRAAPRRGARGEARAGRPLRPRARLLRLRPADLSAHRRPLRPQGWRRLSARVAARGGAALRAAALEPLGADRAPVRGRPRRSPRACRAARRRARSLLMPELGLSLLGLVAIAALVLANGYFVATEFSLVAVRRSQLKLWVRENRRGAAAAMRAVERLDDAIAATQLGITLASIGLGFLGEPALAALLRPLLEAAGVSYTWVHPIAFAASFSLVTFLHVVVGELAPKAIALDRPGPVALACAAPLLVFGRLFRPVL